MSEIYTPFILHPVIYSDEELKINKLRFTICKERANELLLVLRRFLWSWPVWQQFPAS